MPEIPEDIKKHALDIENDNALGIVIEQIGSKVNIILDMSKFDLFNLCQYRYYVRYILNRAPRKKSEFLDKGGLLHEGLDVYYSLLKQGVKFNDRIQAAVTKIKEISANPEQCQLEVDDVLLIEKTLIENLDYWRFEDEQLDIILVEQAFAHVIYEDDYVRIILSGKIDILCNYHLAGSNSSYSNLPIDHKSYIRKFETYRLSNQFMCYADAVGSNHLLVNKIGFQKSLSADEKFKRIPLSYDPLILADWKENVKNIILDEYLHCLATNRWKQNFTSCNKFNRLCEYYSICDTSGAEAKEWKLNTELFEGSPWDVTAKLRKD